MMCTIHLFLCSDKGQEMTWKDIGILVLLMGVAGAAVWWVVCESPGPREYRWFVEQISLQRAKVKRMMATNRLLQRRITALRYDHRAIAREARDQLSLSRQGEIVLYLPRSSSSAPSPSPFAKGATATPSAQGATANPFARSVGTTLLKRR